MARVKLTIVTVFSVFCFIKKNTALHFAAREGHAKAVALLLNHDADIVLNKQQASFLHIALHNKRKEVVITTIRNKRYTSPVHCHLVSCAGRVVHILREQEKNISAFNQYIKMSVVYIF